MAATPKKPTLNVGSCELVASFREMENRVCGDIDKFFTKPEMASLSEYEKLRLRNMRKNYEMMALLGMPVMKPDFMKTPKVEKKRKTLKPVMKDDDFSSVSIHADEVSEHRATVRRSVRASKPPESYEASTSNCTTRLRLKKNEMHSVSKVTETDSCEENLFLMRCKRPQAKDKDTGVLAGDCYTRYPNDSRDLSPATSVVLSRINLKGIRGGENLKPWISADNEKLDFHAFAKKTKSKAQNNSYTVSKDKKCDRGYIVTNNPKKHKHKHKKTKSDIVFDGAECGVSVVASNPKKHKNKKSKSETGVEGPGCGEYVVASKPKKHKHKRNKSDTALDDTKCKGVCSN
ncbi:histone-lysine N-methyltransferase PRDM9-like [Haliotis asinina]|uniref:histone-lysine N-methyltransferase PRDM9-like n=1 Tax=Haliotis asinina TaxID=109174 RepID=UPI003532728B